MAEIFGIDKLFSVIPKKKFGRFNGLGTFFFGESVLGDEDIFFPRSLLGCFCIGIDILADIIVLSGIYRTDNVSGYTRYYREPYYITKNPRYAPQQAWRGIFADAIAGWQGLTPPEKEVYNQRAKYKKFSGYNLFIKEYLSSH